MAREEKYEQAATTYAEERFTNNYYGIYGDKHELKCAFLAGIGYAETQHCWISVKNYTKDELPPLIDKNDPYGESVQALFVVILDGVQYINKGTFDYDTGVWHSLDMQCSFCKENITHWMPLPALPVSSNVKYINIK